MSAGDAVGSSQGNLVQGLVVFVVCDRPRHVAADRAVATFLAAFDFAPVVHRQPREDDVVFSAEIPEVQLAQVPAAVEALCRLDDVLSVAQVSEHEPTARPAPAERPQVTQGDGEAVGHQP